MTEQPKEVRYPLAIRREWSDEQVEALLDHPDPEVRVELAQARYLTPEQRARLVEDPDRRVLGALAEGPDIFELRIAKRDPVLPDWAYDRLVERDPRLLVYILENWRIPQEVRDRLSPPRPATAPAPPVDEAPLDRREAELLVGNDNEWTRTCAAVDPRLPVDLVHRLTTDPSPQVRLAVSMRPELSEEERSAIDYHVGPDDRIHPPRWPQVTRDPAVQRRCVHSAHIGLRRSVACNPSLLPDLVAVLATDDDFAVRLLLCENHANVPAETVLTTYLQARTLSRGRLLNHPAFERIGLARLADSADPGARCLVVLDPEAPAPLIERLSHDPHPAVRCSVAADRRLSPGRVCDLFDDPLTTEYASANPHLPIPVMERILGDAVGLADEPVEGSPAVYLGNWKADELPPDED
ncbi:hypothetical protein [Plantactinospora sp. B5E13]|uniref:hypothetical protein n=1 Tax=unclassified Plantactinospora TaxID=2631981 RepID=UPI00325F84A3